MTATESRKRPLLWIFGAIVVTSAVWATGIVAFGRPALSATATAAASEFRTVDDLCAVADLSAVTAAGFSERPGKSSLTPRSATSKHAAVAEFRAAHQAKVDESLGTPVAKSEITTIPGLGDDAYQIITPGAEASPYAQLWVRVGSMVYSTTWSQYVSKDQSEVTLLPGSEVVELLRKVATVTLPALRAQQN
ncbi:hypothetical protein LTV02_26905 [Nocardia yamanashiensis]|uniref:hypothetical protein n=1 Tax=Nocardia yamanashiensis TaxID=209247 RepID=UPI001E5DC6B3|nr:hypothetical protein [Nocardia yamanashiensis]UGT39671.1 hypothetical protein LTV02_26905 [Nocardia yamanashiensis]